MALESAAVIKATNRNSAAKPAGLVSRYISEGSHRYVLVVLQSASVACAHLRLLLGLCLVVLLQASSRAAAAAAAA